MKKFQKKIQRGFTLIELIIVVSVVAVLASVFLKEIKDAVSPAKSVVLLRAADQIKNTLDHLARTCGVSTAVASNPLPAAGKTLSDVIFGGSANVAAAYTACYASSGVKALTEVAQPTASAGVYAVKGFNVSLSGGGSAATSIAYAAVPDEIVLGMAQTFAPTLTTLAASDAASPVIQYGVAASGARTVTVIKQ